MSKNRVSLNIVGTQCDIVSEENEEYIKSVGIEVNSKMQEVMKNNCNISTFMAAILSSMNFCDAYKKCEENLGQLESHIEKYLQTINQAKLALEKLHTENEILRKKVRDLEIRVKNLISKKM